MKDFDKHVDKISSSMVMSIIDLIEHCSSDGNLNERQRFILTQSIGMNLVMNGVRRKCLSCRTESPEQPCNENPFDEIEEMFDDMKKSFMKYFSERLMSELPDFKKEIAVKKTKVTEEEIKQNRHLN